MKSADKTILPRAERADSVTVLMEQWRRERPDLGTRVPSIVARILRLASHMRKRAERRQAPLGTSWDLAEIIIALRRSGPPFLMTPTELYKSMLLTSGAITSRLDRAEAAGLLKRTQAATDRRSFKVRLTPKGKTQADRAITEYYAEMEGLLDCLGAADAERLANLLSELLRGIERVIDEDDTNSLPAVRTKAVSPRLRSVRASSSLPANIKLG